MRFYNVPDLTHTKEVTYMNGDIYPEIEDSKLHEIVEIDTSDRTDKANTTYNDNETMPTYRHRLNTTT